MKTVFKLLAFSFILILAACGENSTKSYEGDFSYKINSFSYINQDKKEVSLEDLEGNFWVANFIFTNCDTICPPMTGHMARLQQQIIEEDLHDEVSFVSFSVDPEVDDPDTLKEFADQYNPDYSNWHFLTGYSQEEIESFAADSFKTLVSKVDGHDQVNHGTSFFIVTPDGKAIKRYKGTDASSMQTLMADLKDYLQ
ncbi:SCO family protein [Salirhabdus salicampi]|uniref:SCO family protein n=1 Tax=Salirhabdus salicampi TaxID=476102 RepID=UPI0020C22270|nr:SCO family protein [Salirhabdus salicampi]MCP8616028.1 SCO family protein [Salirhabdus salicampi]